MTEANETEGHWHSPDELLAAGKDIMLESRDPETEKDWLLLVNFWAGNVHPDIQPAAALLICKLYNAPVTDYQVEAICKFQASQRACEGNAQDDRLDEEKHYSIKEELIRVEPA